MNTDFIKADAIAVKLEASRIQANVSEISDNPADDYLDPIVQRAAEELAKRAAESINRMLCSKSLLDSCTDESMGRLSIGKLTVK